MNKESTSSYDSDCDEALGWIARLRADNASVEEQQTFSLWLAETPSRLKAMDDMLELWDDLGAVKQLPDLALNARPAANQSRWFAAGAAALAACLVLALSIWPFSTEQPYSLQTALGEQNTFELPDGSQVTLNTDSRMTVSFADDTRSVELVAGEAFFAVVTDSNRPFTVAAGSAKATVVGTAFNVYRGDEHTAVTVTEGIVRVTELRQGSQPSTSELLQANQQITVTTEGLAERLEVDTRPLIAWRDGELIANEMRLFDLVKELERYDDRRILLGDREIAAMTVSGVFPLNNPDALLSALTRTLNLTLIELDNNTLQLLKATN